MKLTYENIQKSIEAYADTFGFAVLADMYPQVIDPEKGRHVVNFTTTGETHFDFENHEATVSLRFAASIACMGGSPTPDELLEAAQVITNAASLVKTLNAADLAYTVKF